MSPGALPVRDYFMLPNAAELAALELEREQITQDPDATPKLLYAIAKYLEWLYALAVRRSERFYLEQRVTLGASGFQLLDFGAASDYWQVFIEDSTDSTSIEIHHGEFLGIVPRVTLTTGRWAQIPCTNSRILLRNAGANPATVVIALTNREVTVL